MRHPGRYRGLPRPSSALKPSHSPDGVGVVGPVVVFVWRLVKTLRMLFARLFWPVHGVIVSFFARCSSVHPSLRIRGGAGLHLVFDGV